MSSNGIGMDMDMGSSDRITCKISMPFNWSTLDACFVSSTQRITSAGISAGSCIVLCLVLTLGLLRRMHWKYNRSITQTLIKRQRQRNSGNGNESGCETSSHAGGSRGVKSGAIRACYA
ncbi:Copper Transporter integral membrane protein that functions in high affinity copper transport [Xylographa bjoerkii]|nr:Copper Transporter integral membrane protein that functions in high affinity copper transport [Xylographa bjoerkii]